MDSSPHLPEEPRRMKPGDIGHDGATAGLLPQVATGLSELSRGRRPDGDRMADRGSFSDPARHPGLSPICPPSIHRAAVNKSAGPGVAP